MPGSLSRYDCLRKGNDRGGRAEDSDIALPNLSCWQDRKRKSPRERPHEEKVIEYLRQLVRTRDRFTEIQALELTESAGVRYQADRDLRDEIHCKFSKPQARVLEQLLAGYTQEEIAEQLGCHPGTLSRMIKAIGHRIESEQLFGGIPKRGIQQ